MMNDPDDRYLAQWQAMQRANSAARSDALHGGGGGGTYDGMEPRVAKLEAHLEHVRADLAKLADVPTKIAALEVKVDHLPGKGFVVGAAITAITALVALLVLLQHLGILH